MIGLAECSQGYSRRVGGRSRVLKGRLVGVVVVGQVTGGRLDLGLADCLDEIHFGGQESG